MRMRRSSGILLHPSSLPGPHGIGELGAEAMAFIEGLAEAGQRLWQVLPLGPTGYGDSPYAPFSTFAGNELLLSLDRLRDEGLLNREELRPPLPFHPERIDYGALVAWKPPLLARAAARFRVGAPPERQTAFRAFRTREAAWLPDYALFRALKNRHEARAREAGRPGGAWNELWPRELAAREPAALDQAREELAEEAEGWEILQFFFAEQWDRLRQAAREAGITVIGDLPIFLALDSAEVWNRRELFLLDGEGRPREVAGVPPDYFAAGGQLWGNPLYDWEAHRREGFAWWTGRLRSALDRFDALRIDHFRGFQAYWSVPAGETTAKNGVWKPGPGRELFDRLREGLGAEPPVIAEDLGFITPEVRALRDDCGFPGMRILQFAFDERESGKAFDPENGFLPHNYVPRTVVYTGTHDNDTLAGWQARANPAERAYLAAYLGYDPADPARALLREAWKSVAAWAIAPLQDILGLGTEARMNRPSTLGGNWTWRLRDGAFGAERRAELRELTRLYGRL